MFGIILQIMIWITALLIIAVVLLRLMNRGFKRGTAEVTGYTDRFVDIRAEIVIRGDDGSVLRNQIALPRDVGNAEPGIPFSVLYKTFEFDEDMHITCRIRRPISASLEKTRTEKVATGIA